MTSVPFACKTAKFTAKWSENSITYILTYNHYLGRVCVCRQNNAILSMTLLYFPSPDNRLFMIVHFKLKCIASPLALKSILSLKCHSFQFQRFLLRIDRNQKLLKTVKSANLNLLWLFLNVNIQNRQKFKNKFLAFRSYKICSNGCVLWHLQTNLR